jgi:glycosyltransferase involved in cell wall biosynthesis
LPTSLDHLLTKNNETSIEATLKSVKPWSSQILVIDQGSTDQTLEICKKYGAVIYQKTSLNRAELRNYGIQRSETDWHLMIEPWEVLVKPAELRRLTDLTSTCYYVLVLQSGSILMKEVRLWKRGCSFVGPAFERIKESTEEELKITIYSSGRTDYNDLLTVVSNWKNRQPLLAQPYYYEACIHLAEGRWEEFLRSSEYYLNMVLNKSEISSVMNRYNYALVQMLHKGNAKTTIQNLILCICQRPLMAEFWCLLGDVHYHLLSKFHKARNFYENAIVLGACRLKNDRWPMDIAKYRDYPLRMIDSCNKILDSVSHFVPLG